MKMFSWRNAAKKLCVHILFLMFLPVFLAAIARPQSVEHPDRPPTATQSSRQAPTPASSAQISPNERALFESLNRERTSRGLAALQWDANLAAAARFHAQRMVNANELSHQLPGEPELLARASAAGAKFSSIAENIAEGPDPSMIHDSWMHSPGHRTNILDPQSTAVGIAVAQGPKYLFAVQDFSHAVANLDFSGQEQKVASLLSARGLKVESRSDEARRNCDGNVGLSGVTSISIIRFEASDLGALPEGVGKKIASRSFQKAAVGACTAPGGEGFTHYRIVVLLY